MTSTPNDELFVFSEHEMQLAENSSCSWKILSVDDDFNYQRSLLFALSGFKVRDTPIEILTANSAASAAPLLAKHTDISVVLLDVVMEEDDSGLKLVNSIRNMLGNSAIRIVLLTGQPGMAPRTEVMKQYDIDEYWNKADLTNELLQAILSSHIRTWESIRQLEEARQGLQLIIDSSKTLSNKRDINTFTHSVLEEIGAIIGIKEGGLIIAANETMQDRDNDRIIAASGIYTNYTGAKLRDVNLHEIEWLIQTAKNRKTHQFNSHYSILYFEISDFASHAYLTIVRSPEPLNESHINLLKVFSENIRSGFTNVLLLNRLTQLAYFDPLLSIHNRNWLLHEIGSMSVPERANTRLLLLDVGQFHDINITFGDHYSDELLKNLYSRLKNLLPNVTAFARVRPNVFALLTDSLSDTHIQLQDLNKESIQFDTVEHFLDFTIADIPLAKMDSQLPEQVLRLSESTLSLAKKSGNDYLLYSHDISVGVRERFKLLQELKQAIQDHQLFIMLQPKVDLKTGAPIGFEALVRWQKQDGSFVPPDVFIPLAETSRLITQIDFEVFRNTIEAVKTLQCQGFYLPVSFNATCKDLEDDWYMNVLLATLDVSGVDPKYLEVEITESQAMKNYSMIRPQLDTFLSRGMKITIDDFGTGYSSLAHITNLSATGLKIDRSFVSELGETNESQHLINMILKLGQMFSLEIIAEGIETQQQREILINHGCTAGQGYFFSKPLRLDDALAWLKKQNA